MQGGFLTALLSGRSVEADLLERVRRGHGYRSVGWLGALGSAALIVINAVVNQAGGALTAILAAVLAASVTLIVWTRLWLRESREPFQYSYSVGEFEPMAGPDAIPVERSPLRWLTRDLTKTLSERVPRLSLLEEESVPAAADGAPAAHVHISGWFGLRRADGWELEVVPEVRLGGKGAPAKLARSVRFRLGGRTPDGKATQVAPSLTDDDYTMLFERVYWSVASQIYAQIHRGVEAKVKLLPRGSLRAAAYVREADDYATSNTLDSYEAAQKLYRQALEVYDIRFRDPPATPWRQRVARWQTKGSKLRRNFRRKRARLWRRAGRRDVMAARAELGVARMLVAEWHLRRLCGMIPREVFEATRFVKGAVARLEGVPEDIAGQEETLFRARVTEATIYLFLRNRPGAKEVLRKAEELIPGGAREDADFLFAAGMVEPNRLRSLRLLGQAVDLNPTMERALFYRAQRTDEIWRRRRQRRFEPEIAELVDAEYKAVITLNPGNLSAWARRGYLGWLLADGDDAGAEAWRKRAVDALEAGRQYKEVRQDATVAELDWTMARLLAEDGEFSRAYEHYIGAVSARLANPAVDFEKNFHLSPTEALVDRYRRYERRVGKQATAARREGKVTERLIVSVKAFVENDCGLVFQANYDRSGMETDLRDAMKMFGKAHDRNPAFVLPAYNLARLHVKEAEQPGRSAEERKAGFHKAARLLSEVLHHEPDWAPARLLMVETQAEMAREIGEKLRDVEKSVAGKATLGSYPIAEAALGDGAEPEAALKVRAEQFEDRLEEHYKALERNLRRLLPHGQLADEKDPPIDALGTKVKSLVDEHKENPIRWTKDFSELHVAALVQWVKVLVITAPAEADRLGTKMREVFYNADTELLVAQCEVAKAMNGSVEADGLDAIAARAETCEKLLRDVVVTALREDPVNFFALKQTCWLSKGKRRRALEDALKANPSATALIWVGDALRAEGEDAGAMHAYKDAARSETSVASVGWLKLARLRESGEWHDDAIDAYHEATQSKDVSTAAEAHARATRLLIEQGKTEAAREEYVGVASNPELAFHLGLELRREKRRGDAILVYEEALARVGEDGVWRTRLQLYLGVALIDGEGRALGEARKALRAAADSGVSPAWWHAAVILARTLVDTEPEQARALSERVLSEEDDPEAQDVARKELAGIPGERESEEKELEPAGAV